MVNRRKSFRRKLECHLQIMEINAQQAHFIRNSFSLDMSEAGLSLLSFDFYPVNERIRLTVFSNAWIKLIETMGRVVWVKQLPHQRKYRVGVEFIETSEDTLQKIKKLMTKGLEFLKGKKDE